jgi:hypothetical protein
MGLDYCGFRISDFGLRISNSLLNFDEIALTATNTLCDI